MMKRKSKYFQNDDNNTELNKKRKNLVDSSVMNKYSETTGSSSDTLSLIPKDLTITNDCNSTNFNILSDNRFKFEFFNNECIDLAKNLLGKSLVRIDDDNLLMKGKIVETECYLGGIDEASHSYNGKITPRNKPMFMKPGTTYVYFTYGMYHCINISSKGDGAAVLIRAVEPVDGIDRITKYRIEFGNKKETSKKDKTIKLQQLCNGPGKLCVGFNINKSLNELDLSTNDKIWIENGDKNIEENFIVISRRIGIDSVGEPWASKPLRFYIYDCPFVSKRDKKQEEIVRQRLSTC